jgi:hypothetical protein
MRPIHFMLLPAVVLVAQAPAKVDLVQRFNTELPGINQMLKELKTQEALTKVQELVPAEHPAFDGSSLQTIALSLDDARGMGALYGLLAKTTSVSGQWEKAVEIQEKRAQSARATLADLERAQAPIAAQWKKVSLDSGDYVAKNTDRQQELQANLKALKEDVDAVNAKKKKLDAKGIDDLKARIAKAPQDEQELAQINAALPVHKKNLANAPKVFKILDDNRKEVEGMIKTADEALTKTKKLVADQGDEITQFNTQQVIKKVKIVGRKNWVDAVMRAHENITKQGSPEEQAAFLSRLLVLDPGNAGAQKALDNLKAGKEAFAKELKPAKKGSAKKQQ